MTRAVADTTLRAWMEGRSLARGLPPPVPDHRGFRVDTGTPEEIARWVFAAPGDGLARLARTIAAPRLLLKLCGTADELRALLPDGWVVQPPAWFMTAGGDWPSRPLPPGYVLEVERDGAVTVVSVRTDAGELAASGYGAETSRAFVYDRIATVPDYRRRGLATAVMTALCDARRDRAKPQLLTATDAGRAVYARLGWATLSPYVTASLPDVR